MSQLVQPGDFCPNSDCAEYGKPQAAAQWTTTLSMSHLSDRRSQLPKGLCFIDDRRPRVKSLKHLPNWPKATASAV